jgi:stage II sporulation protein D
VRPTKALIAAACALTLVGTLPLGAEAATRWSLRGAGFGHGVGLSQFGAFGYARHGFSYRDILAHYYTGTRIDRRGPSIVRVLLQANRSSVGFTGATRAGDRQLREESVYKVTRSGSNVVLRSSSGRRLATYSDVVSVAGGSTLRLLAKAGNGVTNGLYRGVLDVRTATGPGLNAINTIDIEQYLQGVVPAESPPIWPFDALAAQAIAARSYALATNVGGKGFEQYPDTRSQVYRGFNAETASSDNAIASTRGQVLTYNGRLIVTYFFSTSGGYTENVENVFSGSDPKPWLQGVPDPYDDASPYHRWGPYSFSTRTLQARLGSYVRGRFRGIKIVKRGVSPRVVRARVKGSRGKVTVTGPQLRTRLGLRDSWFYLRKVKTTKSAAQARIASGTRALTEISGTVEPAVGRFAELQRKGTDGWKTVANVPVFRAAGVGRFSFHVAERATYRFLAGWAAGPETEIGRHSLRRE